MKTGKFSVEQIIKILKENESGIKVVELCRCIVVGSMGNGWWGDVF